MCRGVRTWLVAKMNVFPQHFFGLTLIGWCDLLLASIQLDSKLAKSLWLCCKIIVDGVPSAMSEIKQLQILVWVWVKIYYCNRFLLSIIISNSVL